MSTTRTKKIIIRVIVILFLASSGLTFVLYITAPSQVPENEIVPTNLEEYINLENVEVVTTSNEEINVDNPEDNNIQVVVTEDENQNEMDVMVDVPMEDGTIDHPTVADFTDNLQLSE